MPTVCPTCASPLDPAHAPIARVRSGKVVSYCSKACADGAPVSETVPLSLSAPASFPTSASVSVPVPDSVSVSVSVSVSASDPEPETDKAEEGLRWLSGSRRRRVIWASAAIMVGGMTVAIIPVISPTASSTVSAADSAPVKAGESVEQRHDANLLPDHKSDLAPASERALSKSEHRAAAIAELERALKADRPREQRLAAIALARLSHEGASTLLANQLKTESSDLRRIDIAYGLALGGNKSGRAHLKSELKSKRRDVRMDAARRLVELDDKSGRDALLPMLGIRSHRVGAARLLARLGDERGLAVLRGILADADASSESKMRAAVGLGLAGQAKVAPFLHKIMAEGKYMVDAAGALAVLGESSAAPALVRQLEHSSMRVHAAQGLVRLRHDVDLKILATALKEAATDGRIAAAEAIVLLTASEDAR